MIIGLKQNGTDVKPLDYNKPFCKPKTNYLGSLDHDIVSFTSNATVIEEPLNMGANLMHELFKYVESLMPQGVHELSTTAREQSVTLLTKMSKQIGEADYRIVENLHNGQSKIYDVFWSEGVIKASGPVKQGELNSEVATNLFQIAAEHTPIASLSNRPILH